MVTGCLKRILVKLTTAQPQKVARVVCRVITYYISPDGHHGGEASGILGDLTLMSFLESPWIKGDAPHLFPFAAKLREHLCDWQ